jgi:hypothetical protein
VAAPLTRELYEENGEGGFTSDLSTSVFDFFFSFFASFFPSLTSFFTFFDLLSFLAITSSRADNSPAVTPAVAGWGAWGSTGAWRSH